MSPRLCLIGPLAHPALCEALGLEATPCRVSGRLTGAGRMGLDRDDWPAYRPSDQLLDALCVTENTALARFAEVMDLPRLHREGCCLLGARAGEATGAWSELPEQGPLLAELARLVLQALTERPAEAVAARLPMIAVWAASRLRARTGPTSGGNLVARRGADDVRLHHGDQPYAGFFALERWSLSHRRHDGGMIGPMTREAFIAGDAVIVLPWDPVRDRVLVIEQFRVAPALRQDPQPWLLEPIAGRVDAGETVEAAALREAREEADLTLRRLIPALHHYPSPGAVAEFLYGFIGLADLDDDVAGIHGLDSESEDIRGHVMRRQDLLQMVLAGQITNGPLAMLALWLDRQADGLIGATAS